MTNGDEMERRLGRLREATRDLAPPPGLAERIALAAAGREPTWSLFVAAWSRTAVIGAVALALCAALFAIIVDRAFGDALARDLPLMGGWL